MSFFFLQPFNDVSFPTAENSPSQVVLGGTVQSHLEAWWYTLNVPWMMECDQRFFWGGWRQMAVIWGGFDWKSMGDAWVILSIHCVRFAFERFFRQSSPCWWFHAIFMIRLIEEILHKLRLVVYPIIYRVLYIQTVVGLGISEPSAVVWDDTFTEFFDLSFWLLRSKGGATSTFCGHKVEVGG